MSQQPAAALPVQVLRAGNGTADQALDERLES